MSSYDIVFILNNVNLSVKSQVAYSTPCESDANSIAPKLVGNVS